MILAPESLCGPEFGGQPVPLMQRLEPNSRFSVRFQPLIAPTDTFFKVFRENVPLSAAVIVQIRSLLK